MKKLGVATSSDVERVHLIGPGIRTKAMRMLLPGLLVLGLAGCSADNTIDGDLGDPPAPPTGISQIKVENSPDGSGTPQASVNMDVGDSINLYAVGRDSDGNFLRTVSSLWIVTGSIGTIQELGSGATAIFTATTVGTGTLQVTYGSTKFVVTITVSAGPNNSPTITQTCAVSINQDTAYSCSPTVNDADAGDSHTWSLDASNTCSWASIDSNSGVVSGSPTDNQVGICNLAFKVNDGTVDSTVATVSLTVNNVAPTLSIANTSLPQASALTEIQSNAAVNASEEGFGVYSLDNANASAPKCSDNGSLTMDTSNGAISFDPSDSYLGTCHVRVLFDDQNATNNTVAAEFSVAVIDSTAPTVSSVTASTSDGSYDEGANIDIVVHFSEIVNVTGSPILALNTTPARNATYLSGSGSADLTFRYTVFVGDTSADLDYNSTSALSVSGAAIQDGSSNSATLTLAGPGAVGSLANSANIAITGLSTATPVAMIHNAPYKTSISTAINVTIGGGSPVTHYKYKLGLAAGIDCTNSTGYGAEAAVSTKITDVLSGFNDGDLLKLCVVGGISGGAYQAYADASSTTWIKDSSAATIQFNNFGEGFTDANSAQTASVTMSAAKSYDVVIPIHIQGALAGTDYDITPASVTILAGQTTANVNFNILRNLQSNPELDFRFHNFKGDFGAAISLGSLPSLFNSIKDVDGTPNVSMAQVATGSRHTCGVRADGALYCWGENTYNQVGDGTTTQRDTPVQIGTGYSQVAANDRHSCGLKTDGSIYCWGINSFGGLGDGTTLARSTPVLTGSGYSQVATGNYFSCGLKTDGSLYCWGLNTWGAVGDGTTTHRSVPTPIGSGYANVATGSAHACAVKTDGSLYCWGRNNNGEVGDGTTTQKNSPVLIGSNYAMVAAGSYLTCGIKTDASLHCWGANSFGQVGDGTTTQRTSPVPVDNGYTQVAIEGSHVCGVKTDGSLYCWGSNTSGQLGKGTYTNSSSPLLVASGISQVGAGQSHTCAIRTDGSLYCWGLSSSGQLGSVTPQKVTTPYLVAADFSQAATTGAHSCGLKTDGSLYCWGLNSTGQIGDGTTTTSGTPVLVGSGFTQVANGLSHTCGLKSDSSLYCWGLNSSGQLGDGTVSARTTPVFIGTGFAQVSSESTHTCAVKTDGSLYCWGKNTNGQIGDGTVATRTTPTLVGADFAQVGVGSTDTCAIKADGSLYCWGYNNNGQLGDGTTTQQTSPVPIASSFAQVEMGTYHACGLKTNGSLYCWGNNSLGQLGDGTMTQKTTPVLIGSGYSQVSAGGHSSCGLKSDGSLYCWGNNAYGQLGDGTTQVKNIPTPIASGFSQVEIGASHTCGVKSDNSLYCWGYNNNSQIGGGWSDIIPHPVLHLTAQ